VDASPASRSEEALEDDAPPPLHRMMQNQSQDGRALSTAGKVRQHATHPLAGALLRSTYGLPPATAARSGWDDARADAGAVPSCELLLDASLGSCCAGSMSRLAEGNEACAHTQ
jgi:hypothetical protein